MSECSPSCRQLLLRQTILYQGVSAPILSTLLVDAAYTSEAAIRLMVARYSVDGPGKSCIALIYL